MAQLDKLGNVRTTDLNLTIAMGNISGVGYVDKFGENPEIDTGSVPEDIWEQGGEYIYDADGTAPIMYLSSDSAADIGQTISVQGLDINGDLVNQEVITDGQNVVTLTTALWRVFRMENNSDTGLDLNGTIYCHIDPTPVSGTPSAADTRAIIDNGNNQTLMALYTVPKGKVGFLMRGEFGMSRSQTAGAIQSAYYSRRLGKVFKIKKRVDITNQGSSVYQDYRSFPDVIPALTDVKLRVEDVTANSTGVFGTFDIMLVDENKFTDSYLATIGQPGY